MKKLLFTIIIILINTNISFAQPSNDLCSGAIEIIPSYVNYSCISYSTTGATNTFTPSCSVPITDDIWFTFTANDDTQVFECCSSSVGAVRLTIYSGTCGSLNEIYCHPQTAGNSETVTGLTVGETYYLSYDFVEAPGNIEIAIHSEDLINDQCSGAIEIVPTVGTYSCQSYTVTGATNTYTPSCASANREDVWFNFTANDDVQLFEICASSVSGMRLAIYSGTCGNLNQLECWGTGPGNTRTVTGLTACQTYYFSYDFVEAPGSIEIAIHSEDLINDQCSNATILPMETVSCSYVTGTNVNATNTRTSTCGGATYEDIWFVTTADNTEFTISLGNIPAFSAIVAVYQDCGAQVWCGVFVANSSQLVTGLTVGQDYSIMVDITPSQEGDVQICVHSPGPLPLELISFTSEVYEEYDFLQWTSASEFNTDYIGIESSNDGRSFVEIDIVNAAGWSNSLIHYEWKNYNVRAGHTYYRLKMVDFDGSFEYSDIVSLSRKQVQQFKLITNPVKDELILFNSGPMSNETVHIEVISISNGQVFEFEVIPLEEMIIDVSRLSQGIYILKVISLGKPSSVHKIVKY